MLCEFVYTYVFECDECVWKILMSCVCDRRGTLFLYESAEVQIAHGWYLKQQVVIYEFLFCMRVHPPWMEGGIPEDQNFCCSFQYCMKSDTMMSNTHPFMQKKVPRIFTFGHPQRSHFYFLWSTCISIHKYEFSSFIIQKLLVFFMMCCI